MKSNAWKMWNKSNALSPTKDSPLYSVKSQFWEPHFHYLKNRYTSSSYRRKKRKMSRLKLTLTIGTYKILKKSRGRQKIAIIDRCTFISIRKRHFVFPCVFKLSGAFPRLKHFKLGGALVSKEVRKRGETAGNWEKPRWNFRRTRKLTCYTNVTNHAR